MKAIILARVSDKKQDSNEAQVVRVSDYVKAKGLEPWKTVEIEESSTKGDREKFQKVIKIIQESKEPIALVVDTVDRLQRSFKESVQLDELRKSGKIVIHFYRENLVIHRDSNSAELLRWDMAVMFARSYVLQLSDNVKRAFEQKRRNGEWTGGVRLGYLNVTLDKEKRLRKDIIIDPNRGHLITEMFDMYSTGLESLETIRTKITKEGLRSKADFMLSKSCIENILKDSFYCGIAVSKKYGCYAHNYPRLVKKEVFDKCEQIRLKRRMVPNKEVSKEFTFKGLLRCQNCGCLITAERKIKKSGLSFVYYSCTNAKRICKRVYIPEKDLLKPVYKVLERFESITEDVQNDLVDELRKTTETEIVYHKAQINRIQTDYNSLKVKLDRLLEAFLDQSITKGVYDKKHQEYQDQSQLLEIEMSEHTKADYNYQTTVATVISVARRAKDIFDKSSDVAGKRAFLHALLQNPTLNGKKLCFTIASPFNLVLQLADSPTWLRGLDSNQRPTPYAYPLIAMRGGLYHSHEPVRLLGTRCFA